MPVTVVAVDQKQLPMTFEAVGQAEGSREVQIRARVSGILDKRVYNEGEPVKAGAELFRIEREPFEIALSQARATLADAQARQEQAKREAARLQPLVEQRAIGRKEYDDAVSAAKQAEAAIQSAQAQVDQAKLNLSYTVVNAPISGITGRAVQSEGSLVPAGTASSLLTTLVQVNPIWIRFSIPQTDFERLRGNQRQAQVRLLKQDGSVAATGGTLNFAASTVDQQVGTIQLRAEFANPKLDWLPGQFARVQVLAGQQTGMLVPQTAVIQQEGAQLVWVVDQQNKVAPRPLQTAGWIGNDWLVVGGLQPGERIAVDSVMKLRPGATVQPKEPAPANASASPSGGTPAVPQGVGMPNASQASANQNQQANPTQKKAPDATDAAKRSK